MLTVSNMIATLALRNRLNSRTKETEKAYNSGTSDHESTRIGGVRRKKRKRDCHHDPWARDLAQIIMGVYYWLTEPTNIKPGRGNGLGKYI